MSGRIGGRLCYRNHAEIDIRIDQAFLIGRQAIPDRRAVRPIDGREASTGVQQIVLVGRVAQQSIISFETVAQGAMTKQDPSTA